MLPVTIILCRPEISKNIGSVCRAMANNDCSDLRIVGNRADYDEEEILRLAIHAQSIWHTAHFFPPSVEGLRQALADCSIVAGTTRRMGEKRKSWGMTPEVFSEFAFSAQGRTGVLFGNERTGLTDEELNACSVAVNIPSSQTFPSLNLSHAVQIVCYTLFRHYSPRKYGYERIAYTEITNLAEHINAYLYQIGLFHHGGRQENIQFLQDIFARTGLSKKEARILENVFKKICYIKCQDCEKTQSSNLVHTE